MAKYKDFPVLHFNPIFKKVKEQLDEIDSSQRNALAHQEKSKQQISVDQEEQVTEEQKRLARLDAKKKVPVFHSIDID